MSRYNQYGNFYDPVGSQNSQPPTAYTYQNNTPVTSYPSQANTSSGYNTTYPGFGGGSYGGQQYDDAGQSRPESSVSSLSANNTNAYGTGYSSNSFAPTHTNQRRQSNTSSLYPHSQAPASAVNQGNTALGQNNHTAFGSSNAATNRAGSTRLNQTPYSQDPQTQQPQRYQSPLHAAQASQNSHQRQASRASDRPSPQASASRPSALQLVSQASATPVAPSPVTVNPSHVYDNRAELQRQAQVDAERRRQREAEQAAKKAEDKRIAEEMRKAEDAQRKALEEQENALEAKRKAEQEAAKKQEVNEKRRKAREEKKRSTTAATALQQLSSGMDASGADISPSNDSSSTLTPEEAEMRAMFQKMREFNAKNPAMLAKLWEEERKTHAASTSPVAATSVTPLPSRPPPPAAAPHQPAAVRAPSAAANVQVGGAVSQSTNTPVPRQAPVPLPAAQMTKPAVANAGGTVYTSHTKIVLAEAATKWLLTLPQNTGKIISKEVIEKMLDANPPYVQLCEMCERNGWKFDRTALARELLKAAPEASKPSQTSSASSALEIISSSSNGLSAGAQIASAAQTQDGGTMVRGLQSTSWLAPSQVNGLPGQGQTSFDAFQSQMPGPNNQRRPDSQPQEVKSEMKPQEPPRPPADKEEAARKRTFNDLVDLTGPDSDDDDMPPKRFMAVPPPAMLGSTPGSQNRMHDGQPTLWKPLAYSEFMRRTPGQHDAPHAANMMQPPGMPPATPTPSYPSGVPQQYQQQQGQTLQQSIAQQQQQQQQVGQQQQRPAAQANKQKGPTPEQTQQSRMKGKMLVEPLMRDRVARKSTYDSGTIARDVLLASGRHPDMRGLNAHMVSMQKLLSEHGGLGDGESRANPKCDLATIRWDIIDPGEARAIDKESDQTEPSEVAGGSKADKPLNPTTTEDKVQTPPLSKARRGRPPKSSLTKDLGDATSRLSTPHKSPRPHTPSLAVPSPDDMSGAVGYAAFRQVDATGAKKKGRPFGWRKDIHSRAAQGLPSKSKTPAQPLPSRLRQSQTPTQVEPKYQIYKCRWNACGAELHNLDTLKKHVVKIHGRRAEEDVFACHWRDCDNEHFKEIETWMEHVDKQHLQPVAWVLGDGPRGGSLSDAVHDSDAYLSDSRGRSVTPMISPTLSHEQTAREAPGGSANTIQWPKRVGRPAVHPDEKTPVDTLQELEKHKVAVGAILDRQGCVLASEERRVTFLEDEDFEDLVYGSEHEVDMFFHAYDTHGQDTRLDDFV